MSFQPGFNLSYGNFDFGAYAENLIEYNLKTSKSLSDFGDKAYSAHLQYTHTFEDGSGIMEYARLMPLGRVRMNSQRARSNNASDISLGGSLILDLPKLGWVQGGYDSFYGASAGVGFNINQRLSLGYTMEKGLATDFDNLGITHEISFAYSFTPNLTEDRVMLEEGNDELVENQGIDQADLADNEDIEELKRKLAENDAIIAELMFRQDSLEANRQQDLERRFEMVMKMVRQETNGERPDLEKKAEDLFLDGHEKPSALVKNTSNDGFVPNDGKNNKPTENKRIAPRPIQKDAIAATDKTTNRPTVAKDKESPKESNLASNKDAIKSRKFKNLEGIEDGYYIVANVYKGGQYMEKFMKDLDQKGIVSNYIDNPENGLKYVYLERYDTWEDAANAYKSNLGGNYTGDKWIMNVDNRYSNEAYASNVEKLKEKTSKYEVDVLRTNVVVKDKVTANEPNSKTYKIDGVGSGFYIIANVFANANNAKRFIKLLNSYGLSASYFINPENNWRYVYLKRHESWNNALISYYTRLNDSYNDKMWIMRVKPSQLA